MIRATTHQRCGALVEEHQLVTVVGYLIHTGTPFLCSPGDQEDWLVTVDKEDGEELAAIARETRPGGYRVMK